MAIKYGVSTYQCGRYQALGWESTCEAKEVWVAESKVDESWIPEIRAERTWGEENPATYPGIIFPPPGLPPFPPGGGGDL